MGLTSRPSNSENLMTKKRILIISPDPVFPSDSGGKIRTAILARELSTLADVTIIGISTYSDDQTHFGIRHITIPFGVDGFLWIAQTLRNPIAPVFPTETVTKIQKVAQELAPDIVIFEQLVVCNLIHAINWGQAELIYSTHNVDSDLLSQYLKTRSYQWLPGNIWRRALRRYLGRQQDKRAVASTNALWTCSQHDTTRYQQLTGVDATLIPNPIPDESVLDFAINSERYATGNVLFVGLMSYPPNIGAINALVNDVVPLLSDDTSVKIVGRNGHKMAHIHAANSRVEILTDVPDISDLLSQAAFSILAITTGGGTRIKALEAMAAGIILITTAKAVEGLNLVSGQHYIRAETAPEMAAAYNELRADSAQSMKIARTARAYVLQRHSMQAIGEKIHASL